MSRHIMAGLVFLVSVLAVATSLNSEANPAFGEKGRRLIMGAVLMFNLFIFVKILKNKPKS